MFSMSSLLRPPEDWITTAQRSIIGFKATYFNKEQVRQCHRLTLLLAARALVLGRDVDDAVGVDVEGDLDLRDPSWGGGDSH